MRALIILLFSTSAFAAGSGSAGDLIPSFFNIFLLLAILVYFLKDPMKSHFSTRSKDTAEVVERAASKAKEAKFMMEREQKKMQAVDAEIKSLSGDVNSQLSQVESEYQVSISERVANLKTDAAQKIEAERKDLLNDLNSTLLDQVIGKSKDILRANPELNTEAAKKMIEGMK